MADLIINEIRNYILSLELDSNITEDIIKSFDKYTEIVKNFYCNAYQRNPKVANDYLNSKLEEFKNKLDIFLNSENSSLEYIEYILNNRELFDASKLLKLKRDVRERYEHLYNKIIDGTYINDFYEEMLTHSSKNFNIICTELYTLARYMGYNDEVDDSIPLSTEEKIYLGSAKTKIPKIVRETVSRVE